MCGRFYTDIELDEVKAIIDLVNRTLAGEAALDQIKVGEIAPTDIVPVYVDTPSGAALRLMRWGFPGYANPEKPGVKPRPIINARSETVAQKPSFRDHLARRCLVPATSYFEWVGDTGRKDKLKYAFQPAGASRSLFYMAAIFRTAEDAAVPLFTVLTMQASASVAPIHDRMPVILGEKVARRAWMRGEADIERLFREAAVREMAYARAV